jgi:phage tail sheath protein FI
VPTVPAWPGVYVEEIPSGVRSIIGVATSVTAFIGRTRRGSIDEPIRCDSWADFERSCGGLWTQSQLTHAVSQCFANGGATAIVARVVDNVAAPATIALGGPGGNLDLVAADPGAWGANLRATVDHGGPVGSVTHTPDNNTFHLTIDEIDPEQLALTGDYERSVAARETHSSVSVVGAAERNVSAVLAASSRLVRATAVPGQRPNATTASPFSGGADGAATSAAGAYQTAFDRLVLADIVNLVVVPPPSSTQDTPLAIWTIAEAWSREHRAVLLVDPPSGWTRAEDAAALTGLDSLRSTNSAFYFPRLVAADPLLGNLARPFAPAGAVAGVIARVDADRGVWKAPAGVEATVSGALRFEYALTEADIGVVNSRGVNALRALQPGGPVVWGARTSRGADTMASEWKYLAVRRLALYIEETLFRGLHWAVFEPNDAPLWSEIRLAVESFLNGLFRAGAFAGQTPREAYRVTCDATTTTQADIDAGIVNILVGFAPLKPAEFVVLKFQQIAGQAAA